MNDRPRLLIVDDDAEPCESMADVLSDAGYDAVTAHDARRALRLSRHGPPPCLILLDLMMPEMTVHSRRAARTGGAFVASA